MQMSVVCSAGMQMSVVCSAAMLMSMGRAVVKGHTDLSGLEPSLVSMVLAASVSGPVVLLQPGAMFMVCAVARKHVEAHNL